MFQTSGRVRRLTGLAAAAAVTTGLVVGAGAAAAAPTPPPNPSDSRISAVAAQKNALAGRVGQLSGQIAAAEARLQQLQGAAELAEQRVALRVTQQRDAEAKAADAATARTKAAQDEQSARRTFVQYVQASYMDGEPQGMTGTLLSASDPNALLQQSSFQQYEAEHRLGAVAQMQEATVRRSNADATARSARQLAQKRAAEAKVAVANAHDAVVAQNQQSAALEATQATLITQRDAAQAELATLNNQRAQYNAFVAEQARLAEIARQKRIAEQKRRDEIARQKAEAAERARENNNNGGGNGGGGGGNNGGGGSSSTPPPSSNGGWTAAKAARAVARAESTLGTPYAWAGGGVGGASYGACVPSAGAPNDCHVRGYDCSGLVMYAWGQYWDHYAATQYSQAGSYHPGKYNLRPGDLVFFSSDGTVGGIHHVAMSLGGDRIIEAPYSGGYVQYNSLSSYYDYYGATRPLT